VNYRQAQRAVLRTEILWMSFHRTPLPGVLRSSRILYLDFELDQMKTTSRALFTKYPAHYLLVNTEFPCRNRKLVPRSVVANNEEVVKNICGLVCVTFRELKEKDWRTVSGLDGFACTLSEAPGSSDYYEIENCGLRCHHDYRRQ
jgi:hypothetical protein